MPIQVISGNFIDAFGASTIQYKSNAGDELIARFVIRDQIRITSVGNPLTLDPSQNVVTSPQVSWLEEGFRVGDWCRVIRYTSGGVVMASWGSQISYVDDIICDFGAMPQWYNITNNEFIVIYALDLYGSPTIPANFLTPRKRDDLDILINHSIGGSGTPASSPSLIDGENSRALMPNLSTLGVGASVLGTFVGNQSGQFFKSCEITRNPNTTSIDQLDTYINYTIDIVFANSGMYNEAWFATTSNLKFFMQLLWASIPSDPYPRAVVGYDEMANTGWFNTPNEISIANSTLIQGISELDYCIASTHDVVVDGVITDIGIGGCYVSTNDPYYRNRVENQYQPTMLVPTSPVLGLPLLTSPSNQFNANYQIQINSVNVVGSQTTINFTFTPNADFNTFIAGVDDGDRLFYMWIKCGNINHLIFGDQLTCDPPVGGVLDMIDDYGFFDHSQNIDEITGIQNLEFNANTEDDLAYFGTFLLEKFEEVDSFNIKIEAYNNITFDDFTLVETNFGFGGVPISGDGRYLLNQSQNVVTTLPTNSLKQDAKLYLYPSLDAGVNYGIAVYYPFLLNWRYWLQQTNANVFFYPNQTKNWEPYSFGDWVLRIEISAIKNGLAFTHTNEFTDNDYDSDANVIQNIELYVDSTNLNVGIVTIGQLMRVVATHELVVGNWVPIEVWGMITVEPYEAEQRKICSSVLPFDNDLSNPLKPLDNVQMIITYPAPNIARMECFFDPDLISLSNGCKFTTKIKQVCIDIPPIANGKTLTDGTQKTTTTGDNKTIAP